MPPTPAATAANAAAYATAAVYAADRRPPGHPCRPRLSPTPLVPLDTALSIGYAVGAADAAADADAVYAAAAADDCWHAAEDVTRAICSDFDRPC